MYSIKDLNRQVDELCCDGEYKFQRDEKLIVWFLCATIGARFEEVAKSLCGGKHDRGIDAVLVDTNACSVNIVQAKYRHRFGKPAETKDDVEKHAALVPLLLDGSKVADYERFASGVSSVVAARLRLAKRKLDDQGYRLNLYYVTTGTISPGLREIANRYLRGHRKRASIQHFAHGEIKKLLHDYILGAAPPISRLELPRVSDSSSTPGGVHTLYTPSLGITTHVLSIRGDKVGQLYNQSGPLLFARNVRGFLGSTRVNDAMVQTLKTHPDSFHYLNNGITIVCDRVDLGEHAIVLKQPQIINGQQTTRTLAGNLSLAKKCSVLVKVIEIDRSDGARESHYDELISRIVAGTNWQNSIKESDLRANDQIQVELQRKLLRYGYLYIRKRQTKSEAKAAAGIGSLHVVKKEDIAQAIAACEDDPWVARSGKDNLFKEPYYSRYFRSKDPYFYLCRYWLTQATKTACRGRSNWSYAKWLVAGFLWRSLVSELSSRAAQRSLIEGLSSRGSPLNTCMVRLAKIVFRAATLFHRHTERGKGAAALEVSQFYRNRKNRHKEFDSFWRSRANPKRERFRKALRAFREELERIQKSHR